jgi:flagellin-like protein
MKGKKGVSPLIATVLLIVIAVSMAGLIFSWINTFTAGSTKKMENRTAAVVDCSGAAVTIKEVYLQNGTSGTVRVVVQNSGYVDNVITAAAVYNSSGYNFSSSGVPVMSRRGEITNLVFTGTSIPTCNDFSNVYVATACAGIDDVFSNRPIGC